MAVQRGRCSNCANDVILSDDGEGIRTFDTTHTKMLVILGYPELDGKKRVVLGPCQDKGDLHRKEEEPVVYYGHIRHLCGPKSQNR